MTEATVSRQISISNRWRMAVLLVGVAASVLALHVRSADAVILPAVTIAGPSEDIVGFGGVAMAEDGTGGLVYLKRVEGVAHVFVARYVAGHWLAPVRVDGEEHFAASSPRIGAANGGELVVVWATPFASEDEKPVDELLSSTLGPGSPAFGPAIIVDRDIRQGTGTSPDLAMSPTGQADVVYRVVEETEGTRSSVPLLRPGDVVEQVRVAHFNGERWSDLGAINRNPGVSMRAPTSANAPQIAIGPTGSGIVVWQEPEINGVARIWARRVFGESLDYVLPVSATTLTGSPIEDDSDAPTVAYSRLGQAEVAYRQGTSAGSPLPGPRIFLNILPDGESANGAEFLGASVADASVAGGKAASVGRPSIDIDEQQSMRLLYDSNGTPRVIEGTDLGLSGTLSLGPPVVGSTLISANELPSSSVMNPEGGGVSAWPSADPHGSSAVAVREDFPTGAVQTGLVSGGAGGPIGELAVGRSGLGDGLVAFQQGPLGNAAIVAAHVTAPPANFVVSVPKGWIRPSQAHIAWEPAASADGPLSYVVVLDGHRLPTPAGTLASTIDPRRLGDGVHEVQLLATDAYGQATLAPPSKLEIDGSPPTVRVKPALGYGVAVSLGDAQSGVNARAVKVSFGDGGTASGKRTLRHRYAHAGVYTIVVHTRDKVGNRGTVRRLVSVR
ncbi:MAG: PKD domain-containing protein [Solirubrobacteraceae bacterium]